MARLDSHTRAAWKSALQSSQAPWIVCGIDTTAPSLAQRLEGMPGLIDWRVHGQVSALMNRQEMASETFCLIPDPSRPRTSFLVYNYGKSIDPKIFLQQLRALKLQEVQLAESTFPEDFLQKVKQHFKKEGIRSTKLEPEQK